MKDKRENREEEEEMCS